MEALNCFTILISSMLPLLPLLQLCWAAHIDTITPTQSLADDGKNTTLISPGQTFELGFFSPGNSRNRYLGIWYKRKPETVVWVANRDNPLADSNGKLTIREGNLVLLNNTSSIVWSPNVSSNVASSSVARLLDAGNFVLQEQESMDQDVYIWQSFDYPTDTLLDGMKLGWDLDTGFERYLTSWKSADDPSSSDVTYKSSVINGLPQTVLAAGSTKKFRSGIWNGVRFNGLTALSLTVLKVVHVYNEKEAYLILDTPVNSFLKLNLSGFVRHLILQNDSFEWSI